MKRRMLLSRGVSKEEPQSRKNIFQLDPQEVVFYKPDLTNLEKAHRYLNGKQFIKKLVNKAYKNTLNLSKKDHRSEASCQHHKAQEQEQEQKLKTLITALERKAEHQLRASSPPERKPAHHSNSQSIEFSSRNFRQKVEVCNLISVLNKKQYWHEQLRKYREPVLSRQQLYGSKTGSQASHPRVSSDQHQNSRFLVVGAPLCKSNKLVGEIKRQWQPLLRGQEQTLLRLVEQKEQFGSLRVAGTNKLSRELGWANTQLSKSVRLVDVNNNTQN